MLILQCNLFCPLNVSKYYLSYALKAVDVLEILDAGTPITQFSGHGPHLIIIIWLLIKSVEKYSAAVIVIE